MFSDYLKIINRKLVAQITVMSDDELWTFLMENFERVEYLLDASKNRQKHFACGFFYAYQSAGIDWMRKHFLTRLEEYRDGVIYEIILDFCLGDEEIQMDYYAQGGFFDHPDSCDVKTSDEVMPPLDEDSEEGYHKLYFHLLEPVHLENIIQAMEKNFDRLTVNTREDIDKLIEIKNQCVKNDDFRAVYIYHL